MRIKNVFEVKNKEEGIGVMDLINGLVEVLWLEIEELRVTAQEALAPVEPWDEG